MASRGAMVTGQRDIAMLDTARERAFGRLTELAASVLGVPLAAISLTGEDRRFTEDRAGMPPGISEALRARREAFLRADADGRHGPVVIADTRREPLPAGLHVLPSDTRAYAGTPLIDASGDTLGTFYVADRVPREWSARDLDVLRVLAASTISEIELHAARLRDRSRGQQLEGLVRERTTSLERVNGRLLESQEDLSRSREETIRRLAGAIEMRCGETGAHSSRMGATCAILAGRMGLDADRAELIRIASPLHDVGKISIPDRILEKPGPLSGSERALVRTHAEIGHRLLAGSGEPLLDLAALMALTHHERMDGRGYPRGLLGDDIPIEGRIAAVADVFDALTNDRAYRGALPVEEAVEMMRVGRGTQFDPRVFDAFDDGLDQIVAAAGRGADGRSADAWSPAGRATVAADESAGDGERR